METLRSLDDDSGEDVRAIDRRGLLKLAIAVAAGLSIPRGALADQAGLTLEEARRIIGDRHKTFSIGEADRKMTADEIRTLVRGNTLYGVLYDDDPYVLSFRPDGAGMVKIADRPLDPGRWWIDAKADTISSQWEYAAKGELLVHDYYVTGLPRVYKTITKQKNRWSMFLVDEGIPPSMVR